jgi:hypothetical protein
MRGIETSTAPKRRRDSDEVTVDRLERAIHTVADMMVKHDMRQLILTIRFLEAERDKLQQETAAMDYAREILRKGRNTGSNITEVHRR